MIEKMVLLKVTNVTYMDEGIYKCRVDKFMYEKISQTYIQVHEPIDAFISLTTQDLNTYYKRHIGDEVEWIVDVDAYPLPELKWINTHGEEITKLLKPGKSKFSIDNACCKPVLKINSLDLSDTGIYTIEARNQYKIEALKFTLDVIAGPKVYMSKPSSYYFPNQVIKVECHVEAFPKPNITWSYRKCPNFPRCEDGILEYLT
ncbi:contactin-1-like, partial [Augochlora pura]